MVSRNARPALAEIVNIISNAVSICNRLPQKCKIRPHKDKLCVRTAQCVEFFGDFHYTFTQTEYYVNCGGDIRIGGICMRSRKLFACLAVATVAAVIALTCFVGCATSGEDGKSAYELAVEAGFEGSLTEWLDSLKGADGADGADGENGKDAEDVTVDDLYEAYVAEHPEATMDDFLDAYLDLTVSTDLQQVTASVIKSGVAITVSSTASTSLGSGVIYKIDGQTAYIITNYHVVYDEYIGGIPSDIDVYIYNRYNSDDAIPAQYLGGTASSDIAIIKAVSPVFEDGNLTRAAVVNTQEPQPGETCIAVGVPEEMQFSVTQGIVSTQSEYINTQVMGSYNPASRVRVFRTDTALNNGNSGGGVFNAQGELIGIANAKNNESGIDNICYAIPAVIAVNIADNVIETNGGAKFVLGITLTNNGDTTTVYDSETDTIVTVETVTVSAINSGSVCEGVLQAGDVLTSIDIVREGTTVETCTINRVYNATEFLLKARVGDTVRLNYTRDGVAASAQFDVTTEQLTSL